MGVFQVFRSSANNEFRYRLKATGNSEIILSGEGYASRQNCHNGIASVKANCLYDARFVRRDLPSNYTFNLIAGNGEIIGRSENYTSAAARENGITAVKRDAPDAKIDDLL